MNACTDLSLLAFHAGDISPFLKCLGQVDRSKVDLHLSDLIVFGETIEIEDGKDQCLSCDFGIRQLL